MSRLTLRRRKAPARLDLPTAAGAAVLGLAAGTALGFLLGELWGPTAVRALTPRRTPARTSVADALQRTQEALAIDAELEGLRLDAVPVGRGAIELHGWVPTRRARARALRLAREAVPESTLIDCLLVHGEDDVAPPVLDADALSA